MCCVMLLTIAVSTERIAISCNVLHGVKLFAISVAQKNC